MSMKKYEFTGETKVVFGKTLHRIKALISFGSIKAGELGGWIEKEENLSHDGNTWVTGNAEVSGNARVSGDAWVTENARVSGNARVTGDARVTENAWVTGNARVTENARVSGNAEVSGNTWVTGNAEVSGGAWVTGNAEVSGGAWVTGNAWVTGIGTIFWIGGIGSRNGTTTFFACKDKKVRVSCGCFYGDLDEFAAKVQETHGDNDHAKVYMLAIEMAQTRIRISDEQEGEA